MATRAAVQTLNADIGDLAAVEAATQAVVDRFGKIDVLVNNAAIVGPNANTWEYPPQAFMDVVRIGLVGTFYRLPRRRAAHDRRGTTAASSTSPRSPARRAIPAPRPIPRPRPA